jgi:hypothetical protein
MMTFFRIVFKIAEKVLQVVLAVEDGSLSTNIYLIRIPRVKPAALSQIWHMMYIYCVYLAINVLLVHVGTYVNVPAYTRRVTVMINIACHSSPTINRAFIIRF